MQTIGPLQQAGILGAALAYLDFLAGQMSLARKNFLAAILSGRFCIKAKVNTKNTPENNRAGDAIGLFGGCRIQKSLGMATVQPAFYLDKPCLSWHEAFLD